MGGCWRDGWEYGVEERRERRETRASARGVSPCHADGDREEHEREWVDTAGPGAKWGQCFVNIVVRAAASYRGADRLVPSRRWQKR